MNNAYQQPDMKGHFGPYGGRYVGETLMPAVIELTHAFETHGKTREFTKKLGLLYKHYAGRPTPLFFAENLTKMCKGAKIYLKREDLAHTGAHKINNTLGQALLAETMGKKKLIAETGAGQHGVATATAAALFNMECSILLQDTAGQILEAHSISAGLDYPGVGPEHAFLKDTKRVRYQGVTDENAVKAFKTLCRLEGIIPALESSHALWLGMEEAEKLDRSQIVIINLSGRGDKDLEQIQ